MDNDQRINVYKKKQINKWLIIIVYLAIIVLEILALLNIVNMIWGCALFVLMILLKKIL